MDASVRHAQAPDGGMIFQINCASCHLRPAQEGIPDFAAMTALRPEAVMDALTAGAMRLHAQKLSDAERIAVTEFITGDKVGRAPPGFATGNCRSTPELKRPYGPAQWNNWGVDPGNSRHQPDTGGLAVSEVPRLTLAWAFGIPGVVQARAQPAVVGGMLFMASQSGMVYALDAVSGCTYWMFQAGSGVRTAISVGPVSSMTGAGHAVYFADAMASAYAVNALRGELIWSRRVDDHPAARVTGAPALYDGVLYVPVSGIAEESVAAHPDYPCCTFRGSITALDAASGEVIWKTYTVPEPQPRGHNGAGTPLWGPAGVSVWSAPTVDPQRGLLYAATGNAFADPAPPTADAVIALELATGAVRWISQPRPGDTWIMGCGVMLLNVPMPVDEANCPAATGPDYDFAASPILVRRHDGQELIIATQKSGLGYALDPDSDGRLQWEYRWGRGSSFGGVWGAATDGDLVYFAVADQLQAEPGGLHAVDLADGLPLWRASPPVPLCAGGQGCSPAQSAALTSMPGVVFSGSQDGGIRAYDKRSGAVIWSFDTNRNFTTVNGIEARGGSIDGAGPVIAGGMLYVTSGNGGFFGLQGNVLLAFAVAE